MFQTYWGWQGDMSLNKDDQSRHREIELEGWVGLQMSLKIREGGFQVKGSENTGIVEVWWLHPECGGEDAEGVEMSQGQRPLRGQLRGSDLMLDLGLNRP